jgi:predicted nucleic acid-binding protein
LNFSNTRSRRGPLGSKTSSESIIGLFSAALFFRKFSRESSDTSIAALAILNHIPLFTKDDHFNVIAKYTKLELYS